MGRLQSLHELTLSLVPSEVREWANEIEVKCMDGVFSL